MIDVDPGWLASFETAWPSETLRGEFDEQGFVMLPRLLEPSAIDRLAQQIVLDDHNERAAGLHPRAILNRHNLIEVHDCYLDLVDHPALVAWAAAVLGWNIQLHHTQLVVAPPAPVGSPPGAYGWHQDNNRMNLDMETPAPHPRVSLKFGLIVSDATAGGAANLMVMPGTHLSARPGNDLGPAPDGAIEITGRPGDAVIFDRRLWHSATVNISPVNRSMLFYGYGYRWLRPKSDLDEMRAGGRHRILHQLLGASPSGANGRYEPTDADVPLRQAMIDANVSSGGDAEG